MFESPQIRAALERVKAFLATHAPAGFIDECALPFIGESDERINEGLNALRREIEGQAGETSKGVAYSIAITLIVYERIVELEKQWGRA
jgi:hypothetical protein